MSEPITNAEIEEMLAQGVPQAVIVNTCGVSRSRVSGVAWRQRRNRGAQCGREVAQTPPRELVERIVRESAEYVGVTYEEALGSGGRSREKAQRARRMAMARIVRETGCSARGLAKVWGMSARSAALGLKREFGAYDAPTVARLTQQHGATRTRAILRGQDPNTNADLASWRRLCATGRKP